MDRQRRKFERIYKQHHQELYRYCFSILRNREDAEDALQATMAAALHSLPGERREIALRPWLFRVAHNEAVSLLRARRRTGELHPDLEPTSPSAEAQSEDRERLRRLVADLRSLPERQASAIVMRELSGLSYGAIGAALSSSEPAARQAVYEGRVALREIEEGREMECESVRRALSDRDGRKLRGRRMKAHLDACDGCRGFAASIAQRRSDLIALAPPLPALAATGILGSLLGGGAHGAGAGAAAAATGGGMTTVGGGLAGSAVVKGASLAAAVVLAAGTADVSGVIDLGHPFGGASDSPTPAEGPAGKVPAPGDGGTAGGSAQPSATGEGSEATGRRGSSATGDASGQSRAPGRSGSSKGKSDVAPGHSGSAPGHSSASPGKSGSAPGHSATSPGKSATAPGHSAASPGKSGDAPGHSAGTSPAHSSTAPGKADATAHSAPPPRGAGNSGASPPASTPSGSAAVPLPPPDIPAVRGPKSWRHSATSG